MYLTHGWTFIDESSFSITSSVTRRININTAAVSFFSGFCL
jgi:hypothetical protein